MTISVDQIPADAEEISCVRIRTAATALHKAVTARTRARKVLDRLEHPQLRREAAQRDAEAAAEARLGGKADPKRTHTLRHEKEIEDARAEVLVLSVMKERAVDALESVLKEHGEAWKGELLKQREAYDKAWIAAANSLDGLHGKRAAVTRVARAIGLDCPDVGMVKLRHGQLNGIEVQNDSPKVAHVYAEDILAALSTLGQPPEPKPEEPGKETGPPRDLSGVDPVSRGDIEAGSPTQHELEEYWADRDARGAWNQVVR